MDNLNNSSLLEQLKSIQIQKEEAIRVQKFEMASELRAEEQKLLSLLRIPEAKIEEREEISDKFMHLVYKLAFEKKFV